MDLDKLLASFAEAAKAELAQRPLVSTEDFVPADTGDATTAQRGATQLVGTFLHWLLTRGQLSTDALALCGLTDENPTPDGAPVDDVLATKFDGAIRAEHIAETSREFARGYLGTGPVGLAADFHDFFVEGTDLQSYCDVVLSPAKREQFAKVIDARLVHFRQGGSAAWLPLPREVARQPPPTSFDLSRWTQEIRAFDNLEALPSGRFKRAQEKYWQVIDAALGHPSDQTARELLSTYLKQSNTALQESVWRVLRTYPVAYVAPALVSLAATLAETGDWLPTLVDLFPADMAESDLALLVAQIDAARRANQLAYLAALRSADRQGSRHAAQLLKRLDAG